mgnify:FL=1
MPIISFYLYVIDYNNKKKGNNNMEKKEDLNLSNSSVSMTRGAVGDGCVNIDMSERFLYKNNCITHAKILIMNNYITGMTEQEIAEEIFAHAVCYYWYDPDGNIFHSNPLAAELHSRGADGILIESGGDKRLGAKAFYTLVWNKFDGK